MAGAGTTIEASEGTVMSWTVTRYCRPALPGVKAAGSHPTATWGPLAKAGSSSSVTGPGAAEAAAAGISSAAAARTGTVRRRDIAR